jgi:hypothetical protein
LTFEANCAKIGQIHQEKTSLENDYTGKNFVLWETDPKQSAYQDTFERFHDGEVVTSEYQVTIVGKSPENGEQVWKAVAQTGEEFLGEVTVNGFFWFKTTFPSMAVLDACNCYNRTSVIYVEEGMRKFPTGATMCERHQAAFTDGNPCSLCTIDRIREKMEAGATN